jgi:dihydroorotate dehydrogenase/NAD-dependent dihydropyrimidine dehydrogenase PreA subunit
MADLTTRVGKLELKNPLVTGAGPLAGTVEHIKKCVDAGFGAVCTKTASYSWYLQRYPRPLYTLKGYTKRPDEPYYVPRDYMWLHREHNSIFPPDKFAHIIKEVSGYCHDNGVVLIGTTACRGLDEWQRTAEAYARAGSDAMELNFCCPFPPKGLEKEESDAFIGIAFSQDPEKGAEVIRKVKETVDIPIFPKISPAVSNFVEMAKIFEEAGADGISMFANDRLLRIDIEQGKPINFGPCAGTSPHLKAHTMRWVSDVALNTNLAILGGRGVDHWEDVIEYLMAGASAVESCAPIMLHGLRYVREMLRGIEEFMDRKAYKSVDEIQGRALKQILTTQQIIDETKALCAEIDLKKCISCYRCIDVCAYDAIKALPRKAQIINEKCVGCTLCTQVCPVSCIDVKERDSDVEHFRALAWEHRELLPELFED